MNVHLPNILYPNVQVVPECSVDDKNVLFPDIALSSGRENSSGIASEDVDSDPFAPRRRFRLFTGGFTRPVPVLERRSELLPFASLPGLRAVAAMLPLDVSTRCTTMGLVTQLTCSLRIHVTDCSCCCQQTDEGRR
jgi:hypothetical protein